jgi:hypothetical protein
VEQIVVSKSAGLLDTLYAAMRYVVVVLGAVPLLLKLLGDRDFAAIVAYFQGADGTALMTAIGALGTLLWGLFKTFRRGKQVANVASSTDVPNRIATLKS